MRKRVVVLTGAGMSADSGIKTFRDHDGLWENYRVEDVATYNAWVSNPGLVLEFYNQRRKQLGEVKPNAGHYALAELEKKYDVTIITQNVDDLHERAGSHDILHLHGELTKVRSVYNENYIKDIGYTEIAIGDHCPNGHQLRPHIVWFGEAVPKIMDAAEITELADILIVIGTSMVVYPAAGLIHYAPGHCEKYLVDPNAPATGVVPEENVIRKKAAEGVPELVEKLLIN